MRVWSSMLYAFRRSIRGSFDEGRFPAGVRGPRRMTRLGISLCAVAMTVAGLSMAVLPATASAEPLCTDSWTGPAEGSWQTASNWSKEEVPGSSDVACIGSGNTVQVTGGSNQASSVQGEGVLAISGGTLELVAGLETSSIGGLALSGGTLSIAGALDLSNSFSAVGTPTISGSGRLVVGSSVSGTIGTGSSCSVHPTLSGVTFVNEGSLTFGASGGVDAGAIMMEEGAEFDNKGSFDDESYDNSCGYGVNPYYYSFYSGGGSTSIVNTGTFDTSAGFITKIGVPFVNEGTVRAQEGWVGFDEGGSGSAGTWGAVSGAALRFEGGSFSLDGDILAGSGEVNFASASVTASGVDTSGGPDVTVSGGTLTIPEGSTMSDTSGTFTMIGTPTITGSGKLVVGPSVSGTIGTSSSCSAHPTLNGVTLVNEGSLTFGASGGVNAGAIMMEEGAEFDNKGTFNDESYDNSCGFGVNPYYYAFYSGSGSTSIVNTGTFDASDGYIIKMDVPFSNQGIVEEKTGILDLEDGGVPEHVATGEWLTQSGASLILGAGTFLVSEEADLSAVTIGGGATVERIPAAGPPHGHLFPYPYASHTITLVGEGKSVGTGFSDASIELTPAGSEEWKPLCGPLTPSLVDEFSCSWDTASGFYPDGLYKARAQLSDASEPPNTGPTPSVTILVDNTPPTGSVAPPAYIGGASTTVSGTAKDSGSGVQSWQLQVAPEGSSEWTNACPAQTSPTSGETYQCSVDTTGLAEGAHILRAIVTDRAGNEYTTATKSTTVDNTPPAASLDEVSEGMYVKGTITLKGMASDSTSRVASWTPEIALEGSSTWADACSPQTTPISGSTYGCSLNTTGYSDGKYQIRARAENNATDTHTTSVQTVTIDNALPTGSLDALELTNKGTITVEGPASDPEAGVATWQLEIRSATSGEWHSACLTQSVPIEGDEYGCSLDTTTLIDGSYLLHAVITDNAGNIYTTRPVTTHVHNSEGAEEGPSCTDDWTGETGDDKWQTGDNWSTGSVPTSSDHACIPSGATVIITSGTTVGSITGEGDITVASGSLELADNSTVSEIGGLALDGTSLTGSGTLYVSSELTTNGSARIDGAEEVVVDSGASGTIDTAACTMLMLDGATLRNDGTLTLGASGGQSGQLDMEEGGHLDNAGTFNADSYEASCVPGSNVASIQNNGGSPESSVTNTGTFSVDVGSANNASVDVPFDTSGHVDVLSGTLALSGGDTTGGGRWESAAGAQVDIASGSYTITEADASGASFVVNGGTLNAQTGTSSVGSLSVNSGKIDVTSELEVTSSFTGTGAGTPTIDGAGSLVIGSEATGTIDKSVCNSGGGDFSLDNIDFVNRGNLTLGVAGGGPNGDIVMSDGAQIHNSGTFNVDSWSNDAGPCNNTGYSITLGSGSTPNVTNTSVGTFNADIGGGNDGKIGVPFNNEGTVTVESGALSPVGGDSVGAGTWRTSGSGNISVPSGSYALTEADASGASFVVDGGTLNAQTGTSSVGSLSVNSGKIDVTSELEVTSSFTGTGVGTPRIEGAGRLVMRSGANGTIDKSACNSGGGDFFFDGVDFVNQGTFTLGAVEGGPNGDIVMSDGAQIHNSGTFNVDSWSNDAGPCNNTGYSITLGSGSTPSITNTGRLNAEVGEGNTAKVGVPFNNDGVVKTVSGDLVFSDGGVTEQAADGSWEASEGAIILSAGTFILVEGTNQAGIQDEGAHIVWISRGLNGSLDTLPPYVSGTVTVSGSGEGGLAGPFENASIEVRPEGSGTWTTLCGPLTPSLTSTFECSWNTASGSYTDGYYELRAKLTSGSTPPENVTTTTMTVMVDNTAPGGSIEAPPSHGMSGVLSVAGTATDSGSGVLSWQPQIAPEGSSEWADICPAQTSATGGDQYGCTVNTNEHTDGAYELRAVITDRAGNTYTTSSATLHVANEAVTGALENVPSAIRGMVDIEGAASADSATVESWELQEEAAGTGSWDRACPLQTVPVSGSTYRCEMETAGLADGPYELRAVVTNSEGDTYVTGSYPTMVDNTPPVGFIYPLTGDVTGEVEVQGYAADAGSGVAEWKLQIAPVGSETWSEPCLPQTMPAFDSVYGCTITTGGLANGEYQLRAIITDTVGNSYTTEPVTMTVDSVSPSSTTAPAISGQPVAGHIVRASEGKWSGAGPMTYAYQWQRCNTAGESCTNISGATASTYTPSSEDVGSTLTVVVTATNGAGDASASATPTAVVIADTLGNVVAPKVTGSPQVGAVLTADPGEWRGVQPFSYAYQWQLCDSKGESCADISGARPHRATRPAKVISRARYGLR